MSILFATACWPHPLAEFIHGTAQRMRLFLKAASRLGEPLDLLLYRAPNASGDASVVQQLKHDLGSQWGVSVRQIYLIDQAAADRQKGGLWNDYLAPALMVQRQPNYSATGTVAQATAFRRVVDQASPSLLFVHRLSAMLPVLASRQELPAMVFDLDDIEHKAFERLLAMPPHWGAKRLMGLWVPAIRRLERQAVRASRTTFVCSQSDADELNRRFAVNTVRSIPNAVKVPAPSPVPKEQTLLFLGMHDYPPNRLAAEHLVHEVWPLIRQRHPHARLLIAGKGHLKIRGSKTPPPGVEFLGFVNDLDLLYAQTRVVACPILSGGGTRIKIIEAALRGRPVVSTTLGAEGLEFRVDCNEIIIADGTESFAAAVSRLFQDPSRCEAVGIAAKQRALAIYDEDPVIRRIAGALHEAVNR